MSTVSEYQVDGMTCEHCVRAVTAELTAINGVRSVAVDLVAGAISVVTVTSDEPLQQGLVAAAVEEAGYFLSRS